MLARDYLREFNPELPVLAENVRGLADFADNVDAGADDIVTVLDNVAEINRNLVDSEDSLEGFLRSTTGVAGTAEDFVAENADRFVTLPRENLPVLDLFELYTPQFPCLFDGLVRQSAEGERVFGGLQPGLHITAEFTEKDAGYRPGDEPFYGEDAGPTCFGLDGPPIIPFPILIEPTDGYCDDQEQQPGIQTECEREPQSPPPGPPAAATPFSPASYDRAAVGVSVAPALGLTPAEVPDIALLLFAPVARS